MDKNCCILQNLKKVQNGKKEDVHINTLQWRNTRGHLLWWDVFLPLFSSFSSLFPSFSFFLFGRVSKPAKEINIFFFFCIRFRLPRNRKSSQGHFVCFPFAHSLFCKFVLFLLSLNCTKIQEIYLLSLNNTLLFSGFRKLDVNGPIGEDCTWFNFVRKSISV